MWSHIKQNTRMMYCVVTLCRVVYVQRPPAKWFWHAVEKPAYKVPRVKTPRVGEMAQQAKELATKPDDLSLTVGPIASFCSYLAYWDTHSHVVWLPGAVILAPEDAIPTLASVSAYTHVHMYPPTSTPVSPSAPVPLWFWHYRIRTIAIQNIKFCT